MSVQFEQQQQPTMAIAPPHPPLKRRSYSFAHKSKIIEAFLNKSPSQTKAEFAKEHGLSSSTLLTILKNRDKIDSCSSERKKQRKCDKDDLDECLYLWFKDACARKIPLSDAVIKQKAESLAWDLGYYSWTCSHGWFFRWKARHNLIVNTPKIKQEADAAPQRVDSAVPAAESLETWLTSFVRSLTAEETDQQESQPPFDCDSTKPSPHENITPTASDSDEEAIHESIQHDPTCAILTQSEINLSEPPPVELIPRSSAETSIEILKAYFQQRRNESALGICAELQRLVEQEQQHKADTLVSLFTAGEGGTVTRNL